MSLISDSQVRTYAPLKTKSRLSLFGLGLAVAGSCCFTLRFSISAPCFGEALIPTTRITEFSYFHYQSQLCSPPNLPYYWLITVIILPMAVQWQDCVFIVGVWDFQQ